MGVLRPELVMKSIVPIVMAGVLGIYGLIISVIISTGSEWLDLLLRPSLLLREFLRTSRTCMQSCITRACSNAGDPQPCCTGEGSADRDVS